MIDTAYFLALFFIFIRITAFLLATKVFFPNGTPKILKGVIGMILSFGVISGIDYGSVLNIDSNYSLIYGLLCEVLCGVTLGIIVNIVFQVVKMAGAFIDLQVGFAMMNVVDPNSSENTTILSNLMHNLAIVLFFIANGHYVLIGCLIKSFSIVPIGKGINFSNSFETILGAFIKYFELGIRIALPIILVIFIAEMSMALVSRTVPQINILILGIPIKIVIGLVTLTAILPILIKTLHYGFDGIEKILYNILKSLTACPILLFFAKDDKTEEPTGKKLHDAKKKGQVARSKDLPLAISLVACTLLILLAIGLVASTLKDVMHFYLSDGLLIDVTDSSLKQITLNFVIKSAICLLPFLLSISIAGMIASIIQTGFMFTTEPLKFNLNKINPINGVKNMFSKKALLDLIKNLIVVVMIGFLAYSFVKENYNSLLQVGNIRIIEIAKEIKNLIVSLFFRISIFMVILSIIDYILQKRIFKKDMRMTKQEVKDEYKQMEGDPKIKSKIRQKQRQIATRRMMEAVPDATVVITNPTHLAIAIKYIDGEMEAPKVVAKGADNVALKIKEIAKEHNVPIMENKPLARMMYEKVEIDEEIPQDMYQAVAEILAMVFKLKNKK